MHFMSSELNVACEIERPEKQGSLGHLQSVGTVKLQNNTSPYNAARRVLTGIFSESMAGEMRTKTSRLVSGIIVFPQDSHEVLVGKGRKPAINAALTNPVHNQQICSGAALTLEA